MARLESQSKGGFYPTRTIEMEYILKRIRSDEGEQINSIDRSCGEGKALNQCEDYMENYGTEVSDYGIEIETTRAEKAEDIVTNHAKSGYEDTIMARKQFSAMYLKPAFMDSDRERLEL